MTKDAIERALKPCPFCGSAAIIREDDGITVSEHYTAQAMCGECPEVSAITGWGDTMAKAKEITAEAWNTRTPSDTLAGDFQALKWEASRFTRDPKSLDLLCNFIDHLRDGEHITAAQKAGG